MPQVENNRAVETTTEARASVTGHHVRTVLIFGIATAIVLFALAYYVA